MRHDEMDSGSGLELPGIRRTARLLGRALLLRCPNCGGRSALDGWFKLRVKCGTCGLRFQRGEHDYFVGSMLILFVMVGLFTYAVLFAMLLATDATPWDLLESGLPLVAILAIFAFFPFAKLLWLAFDLTLRPATPGELEWHREAGAEFSSERDAPRR